jgi:phosphoglycolate phosphatase
VSKRSRRDPVGVAGKHSTLVSAFELVIFDCDGVLVDSEPLVNRAFVETLAVEGVALDLPEYPARFTGASLAARIAAVREEHGWQPSAQFERDFELRLMDLVRRDLRAVPGVGEVVACLELERCVASNASLVEMTTRLAQTGLLSLFAPHLFSATDCPRPKPFPDVYLHAASTMGATPQSCAVVEDSVPGIEAGLAAGMTVFAYCPGGDGAALARLGAHAFTSMAELPELLLRT